jgi:hypothetical protein
MTKRRKAKPKDIAAQVKDMTEEELAELMRRFPERTREECIAYQRSQGWWPKETKP